jgi:hypothetical protein
MATARHTEYDIIYIYIYHIKLSHCVQDSDSEPDAWRLGQGLPGQLEHPSNNCSIMAYLYIVDKMCILIKLYNKMLY